MRRISYTKKTIFTAILLLLFISCSEDMLPDYMVDQPRSLAIKVENTEVQVGDTVRFRFLVGGKSVDQNAKTDVFWFSNPENPEDGGFVAPYNRDFEMGFNENMMANLPDDMLKLYDEKGWLDFPVTARVTIDDKRVSAMKTMRIRKDSVHKGPKIEGIKVSRLLADEKVSFNLDSSGEKLFFPESEMPENFAVTAVMDDERTQSDVQYLYRWYVSLSKDSDAKLYINSEDDAVDELIPLEKSVDEFSKSAIFSLYGEKGRDDLQEGIYDIYLVVREKAIHSTTRGEDRLGIDFFYFTLCVGECD